MPFVAIQIQNTNKGIVTDDNGQFLLSGLNPGYINIEASFLGYEKYLVYEIQIFNNKPVQIEILLKENSTELDEVVIKPKLFEKPVETPNSIKNMGVTEIKRVPGGGQDISRIIQTLPGVTSSPAINRNDIMVRGGGPTENSFYVDDFEVNAINHFSTQGASGGIWGIIDANHLSNFNLSTGAFPMYADNTLSSVFNLELKRGNTDKFESQINLGTIQRGVNFDGPIGEKTTFLAGIRQANFDLLFTNSPIIPLFTDGIAKLNIRITQKSELELFGISAIDNLNYNTDIELTDENFAALERARKIEQVTYTAGAKLTHYWKNGNSKFIYSHNNLKNSVIKYLDNDETKEKILNYNSYETTERLEIRNLFYLGNYKLTSGINYKKANYDVTNNSYQVGTEGISIYDYNNKLSIDLYGLYVNIGNQFMNNKLGISMGFRMDANNFSKEFSNPLQQFSPRASISYELTNNLSINASSGIYYQNPSLTSLGYIENDMLINKTNNIKPIKNFQIVLGSEYNTKFNSAISVEGFYKNYQYYPFSVNDKISLANKGAGFGVFGDEELVSTSEGRSYGVELFYQQKLFKGYYGMFSFTWVKSEFKNSDEKYTSSSWDYGNIVSIIIGKRFRDNWEIGGKWMYYGGIPYTPFNEEASALIANWILKNRGIEDYTKLNQERTNAYHQLDIRVDKKFFFKKWNLNLFLDLQNVYNYVGGIAPNLILDRDDENQPQVNPEKPDSYIIKYAENEGFGIRPNLGFIVEF